MSYEFIDVNNKKKNFLDEIEKLGFKDTSENCYTLGNMSIMLNEFGEDDDTIMCCTPDSVFNIYPEDVLGMSLKDTSSNDTKFFFIAFKTHHENVCSYMCNVNIT